MPIPHLTTAGATLLAALTLIAAEDSGDAIRCSIFPFSGGRGSQEALLLGSASADTVLAGAGEVMARASSTRAHAPRDDRMARSRAGAALDRSRATAAAAGGLLRPDVRSLER